MTAKTHYIDNQDLMEEWRRWIESGETPEDRTISDALARMMMEISNRILASRYFGGYPQQMLEDMAQEACIKMVSNLKNFKPERGSLFSYFSRIVFCACATHLKKFYKRRNAEREVILLASEQAPQTGRRRAFVRAMRAKVEEYGG